MSFNKAKALKAASRYVQQGKFQSAIEEYRRIVQAEPSDITTLNTLGDLYVKTGDHGEAIRTFMRIAEHYRAGSFNLKAIAMLKKVSKLDPQNVDVSLKLAGLYAHQKLIVDARQQYLAVAEHYLRGGQQKQALAIYQKIADLDPENTSIQLKLAEAYLRENQTEQAFEAYMAAASEVQRQSKYDEALDIYLKALKLKPEAHNALNSVVNLYIQRDETRLAADLIVQMLKTQEGNAELLTLLGRIYQSAGDLEQSERALTRAVESDPSRYQYLIDLAEIALRNNDPECALRQVDAVMEYLYERREEEKAIAIMHEVLARDPGNFGALERLAAVFSRIREDHNLIDTLNSLADAAIRKGEDEIAIRALAQLARLEPDEIRHRRRLRSLGLTDEEIQRLGDTLQSLPAQTQPVAAADESSTPVVEAAFPGTGMESSGSNRGDIEFRPEPVGNINADGFIASDSSDANWGDLEILPAASEHNQVSAFSGSVTGRLEMPSANGQQSGGFEINPSEIDLSGDFQNEIIANPLVTGNSFDSDSGGPAITFSAVTPSASPDEVSDFSVQDAERVTIPGSLNLSEELESIDFYFAQGMLDVARHTIDTLKQQFPGDPEVEARHARLLQLEPDEGSAGAQAEVSAEDDFHSEAEETEQIVLLSSASGAPTPQNGFAFHDLEAGTEIVDQAGQEDIATAAPTGGPGNEAEQSGVPLDGLLNDLNSLQFDLAPGLALGDPATERPAPSAAIPGQGATAGTETSLNELFSLFDEFRAGAEQETSAEDFETHYNLGLAYKDMEMYDEAVEEFQQAWKSVSAGPAADEARQNQLLCCSMLGFCFSQKNLPRPAVMWLRRGLEVAGRTEHEYQALRYDLAAACEALGDLKSARDILSEVYAIDVNYRGVSEKLQGIQSRLAVEQSDSH